ncbi:MAG: hypothetical protein WKF84_30865 [Pyrinomonadaceae bacterium]
MHDTYKDNSDKDRTLHSILPLPIPTPNIITPKIVEVDYERDCVPPRGDLLKARLVASAIVNDQFSTFAIENDPLGRLDPFHGEPDLKNPVTNPLPRADKRGPSV